MVNALLENTEFSWRVERPWGSCKAKVKYADQVNIAENLKGKTDKSCLQSVGSEEMLKFEALLFLEEEKQKSKITKQ